MKKLMFLGLLSLVTINYLCADEYISDTYFEEVAAQSELMYESMESLPIAKTVEDEAREKEAKEELENEVVVSEIETELIPLVTNTNVMETKQTINVNAYAEALKQAKREGKIIMLSIRANNCKYCDKMEAETLSDSSVKEALEDDFITLNYNQDLDPLPLNLQNGTTPMFIFVNTNEDIINMYPGIRSPEEFKEGLKQILAQ